MRSPKSIGKSLLRSWLISHLIILTIPLIGVGVAFQLTMREIIAQIERGHEASLNQIREVIDSHLDELFRFTFEIGWNPNVERVYLSNDISSRLTAYNIYLFHRDMSRLTAINRVADGFFVYLPPSQTVLTFSARYNAAEYADFHIATHSRERFFDLSRGYSGGRIASIDRLDSNGAVRRSLAWYRSFPADEANHNAAVVVSFIDIAGLEELLSEYEWIADAETFLVDANGGFIAGSNGYPEPEIAAAIAQSETPRRIDTANGAAILSSLTSELSNLQYVSVIPTDVFLGAARWVRFVSLATLAACFAVAFFFSTVTVLRDYRPIKSILALFPEPSRSRREVNELRYIEAGVNALVRENDDMRGIIEDHHDSMRRAFLSRLISGRMVDTPSVESAEQTYGVDLNGPRFMIMQLYLEEIADTPQASGFSRSSLNELIEEIITPLGGLATDIDGVPVALFSSNDFTDRHQLRDASVRLRNEISDRYGLNAIITFGSPTDDLGSLHEAHHEAQEATEFVLFFGKSEIQFHDELEVSSSGEHVPSLRDLERHTVNCIRSGELERARMLADSYLDTAAHETGSRMSLLKVAVSGFLYSLLSTANSFNGDAFENALSSPLLDAPAASLTISTVREEVHTIIDSLQDKQTTGESTYHGLTQDAERHVKSHYRDRDLSVGAVADHLGVTAQYLSMAYKRRRGVGLLHTIHAVRLRHVRKLLTTTSLTLKEIAEQTGYYSDVALIRAFKRHEGVSPGKYRAAGKTTEQR